MLSWEAQFLLWIQENLRNEILDAILVPITHLGDAGWFWIALVIGLLIYKPTRKMGKWALISLVITFLICNGILKPLIARTRPYDAIEGLEILVNKPHDYSFPSGHTSASFSVAWILFLQRGKTLGWMALVLALAIALSRFYVGVHYPSDVLAGFVVSTCVAWAVHKLSQSKNIGCE